MKSRAISRMSIYVLGPALLIAASFLAGSAAGAGQPVNAQAGRIGLGPDTPTYTCTITYLAVYDNRIQVECNYPSATFYLAAPFGTPAESRQTNRLLALLNTAVALNKHPVMWFNTNPAANPPGCSAADCRLLQGVVLMP